jgi:F0F1-type ATP synthase assembly protein I
LPQKPKQKQKQKQNPKQSQLNGYLKYSGLAFQMIAVIGLAVWAGWEIDQYLELRFPVFLIVLSLMSVTASIVLIIKSLPK